MKESKAIRVNWDIALRDIILLGEGFCCVGVKITASIKSDMSGNSLVAPIGFRYADPGP